MVGSSRPTSTTNKNDSIISRYLGSGTFGNSLKEIRTNETTKSFCVLCLINFRWNLIFWAKSSVELNLCNHSAISFFDELKNKIGNFVFILNLKIHPKTKWLF